MPIYVTKLPLQQELRPDVSV